jgi:antitoxin component YwqK of YwqJK toxin-antitoxin module
MQIRYREDGSKETEIPDMHGKRHGTAIYYREDRPKWREIVWENGKRISEKKWDEDGNLTLDKTF